jgi:hypothetical protein
VVDAVVKVGGRLGHDEGVRGVCLRLGELGRRHRLLVVPGGGAFADAVRDCDTRFGLSDDAAHWMAILAMDQYGRLLGELIPGVRLIRSFEALDAPVGEDGVGEAEKDATAGDDAVSVLLPHDLLRDADPLPHSWAVTSDAIAAWVAAAVRAPLLVLLKHGGALGALAPGSPAAAAGEPETASADEMGDRAGRGVREASLAELGEAGIVDEVFAGVVEAGRASGAGFDVWLLDGGRPERLEALLETGRADGVRVGR